MQADSTKFLSVRQAAGQTDVVTVKGLSATAMYIRDNPPRGSFMHMSTRLSVGRFPGALFARAAQPRQSTSALTYER